MGSRGGRQKSIMGMESYKLPGKVRVTSTAVRVLTTLTPSLALVLFTSALDLPWDYMLHALRRAMYAQNLGSLALTFPEEHTEGPTSDY